jgi:hypothetical protein
MTAPGLLVEVSPGVYERKPASALKPTDAVVFGGGPDAFAQANEFQRRFDAEVAAAGGLEAWRQTVSPVSPLAA